jgi:glycosyltransferase involved in cell wall biosynthesis
MKPAPATTASAPAAPSHEPRRILYVENGIGFGGAVICLRHLIRHLDPARYAPLLVTGRTGPEYQVLKEDCPWWVVPDRRVDVRALREWLSTHLPGGRSGLGGRLVGQVAARTDDVGNFLPQFAQLWWLARRLKPALIHANNEPLCNRAALLVARLLGIPSVCHVRGVIDGSPLTRASYRLPTRTVSVSHWIDEGIAALGIPPERRHVVYDGIELDRMDLAADGHSFRSRLGLAAEDWLVGLVGLLIPWKGQRLLLDAAPRLLAGNPRLKLMFIGTTPADCRDYEAQLRARVEREGMSGRVIFAGHQTDMPAVYNGVDVVLSASTEPEPLGTVVIESMTMARPLVAPAFGGALEMARDDETALLFPPGDAAGLAACIERLQREAGLGERLGAAARQQALTRFAIATHAERIQSIYDDLLASNPGSLP